MEHIFALRHLLDTCRIQKWLPMVFLFVDFSKAFDSVSFVSIRKALQAWQIGDSFIDAILAPYNSHTVTISGCKVEFKLEQGVLQGDTVAPYLFLIVLDAVLHKAIKDWDGIVIRQSGTRSRGHIEYLTDMNYADDLLILSHSIEAAERQLHRIQRAAAEVGLSINVGKGKTEYMTRNICNKGGSTVMRAIDGKEIECVETYKYLGVDAFDAMKDFKNRKGKAWAALKRFEPLFKAKGVAQNAKVSVVMAMARSVFSYGGSIWPTTLKWQQLVDTAFTQMLRYALQLPRHTPLEELYLNGAVPRLTTVLQYQRLATVGHALRHDTVFRTVLRLRPKHEYSPTRPKAERWAFWKTCLKEMEDLEEYVVRLAQDRTAWRKRIRFLASAREKRFYAERAKAHLARATDPKRVIQAAWAVQAELGLLSLSRRYISETDLAGCKSHLLSRRCTIPYRSHFAYEMPTTSQAKQLKPISKDAWRNPAVHLRHDKVFDKMIGMPYVNGKLKLADLTKEQEKVLIQWLHLMDL
jgi:hypothetical protein